ncbi:MAG: hypothetical protein Q4E59_05855 [Bacteroidales bacterium]|nr:hypothetical protein [Bacteroidales bacterium]
MKDFKTVEGFDASVGIANVATDGTQAVTECYDLEGRKQKAMQRGLNVVRYKDGTTKKMK